MKIATIIGARPQFIKAASVSRAINQYNQEANSKTRIEEVIIHTGQHFDDNMSAVFFRELRIPKPHYYLGINSLSHGAMTGQMLEKIEPVLMREKPDWVLVYGDTNSTLAGALAAVKLHIPVAHVEAGLRSYNRKMPEEVNRVLTDHVSELLFCPTNTSVANLAKEGITRGVYLVGDVMFDAFLYYRDLARSKSKILSDLSLRPKTYCLATVHREENTSNTDILSDIFESFESLANSHCPFIVPVHPKTQKSLHESGIINALNPYVRLIPPLGYLDMLVLESNAKIILTDSGGVQKEACFAQVPCVTLREETEWVEIVNAGVNMLSGTDKDRIIGAFNNMIELRVDDPHEIFGNGSSSGQIVEILEGTLK